MNFAVRSREKLYFGIMLAISILLYGLLFALLATPAKDAAAIYIGLIGFILFLNVFVTLIFVGTLKGNAIKINAKQFPDIYAILESHSQRLGLSKTPDMYLLQGNGILNAFALKFARRNYVVLHSNILEIAYQDMDVVSFIIGHELGHIKRNHTGFLKSFLIFPAKLMPFLGNAYSRACEYTCDNIGFNLCPKGAVKGILVLAVGKKLYTKVNLDELLLNVEREAGFALKFAEIFSTHPVLVKRIAVMNQLTYDDLTPENGFFNIQNSDFKQSDKSL